MKNLSVKTRKAFRKAVNLLSIFLVTAMILTFTSCANKNTAEKTNDGASNNVFDEKNIMIKTSPDKYTWYIKNYVGKNCATIGYTAINGKRMDTYGEGYVALIFVDPDGSYPDIESDEALKEYSVVSQNTAPNTELKLEFEKDSEGNEYENLVASQNIEEIVLCVMKNGTEKHSSTELTEINPSPDKYTRYIRDYVGRNLANCGYTSIAGFLVDSYGDGYLEFVIVADDGSYVDPEDTESLRNYVVVQQNIAPNTELKLTFSKDSDGVEYSNLVNSQNIEEIELYVKALT